MLLEIGANEWRLGNRKYATRTALIKVAVRQTRRAANRHSPVIREGDTRGGTQQIKTEGRKKAQSRNPLSQRVRERERQQGPTRRKTTVQAEKVKTANRREYAHHHHCCDIVLQLPNLMYITNGLPVLILVFHLKFIQGKGVN